jgi:predicted secreted Zn-dependent protease
MVKFRPAEDHHFFAYLFLQRLPKEVRVLLARDDCKEMQALAEKADGLMALHSHQGQEVSTIAADRPAAVAALSLHQPANQARC